MTKINILAKFHEEMIIFDEIKGHLLILPFKRAQVRAPGTPLRNRQAKFSQNMSDVIKLKVNKFEASQIFLLVKSCEG